MGGGQDINKDINMIVATFRDNHSPIKHNIPILCNYARKFTESEAYSSVGALKCAF